MDYTFQISTYNHKLRIGLSGNIYNKIEIPESPAYYNLLSVVICSDNTEDIHIDTLVFPSCIRVFRGNFLKSNGSRLHIKHIEFHADNLEILDDKAFIEIAHSLEKVTIHGKYPWLGSFAFSLFKELRCVDFKKEPPKYLPTGVFSGCKSLDIHSVLREGVLGVDYSALTGCNAYNKRLIIPDSVQYIDGRAISRVSNLHEVECKSFGFYIDGKGLFNGEDRLDFYIGAHTEIDKSLLGDNVNIITMPSQPKDKQIESFRAKYSLLSGMSSSYGYASKFKYTKEQMQLAIGLIPEDCLKKAVIKAADTYFDLYLRHYEPNLSYINCIEYNGLCLTVAFEFEGLHLKYKRNHSSASPNHATKTLDTYYIIYDSGRILAFPIAKDLIYHNISSDGSLIIRAAEIHIELDSLLGVEIKDNSLVTFEILGGKDLSYSLDT